MCTGLSVHICCYTLKEGVESSSIRLWSLVYSKNHSCGHCGNDHNCGSLNHIVVQQLNWGLVSFIEYMIVRVVGSLIGVLNMI